MERQEWLGPVVAFALFLGGCDQAPELSDPGTETGPCIDARCFDGLSCLSNLCVDPTPPNEDGDGDASASGPDDGAVDDSADDGAADDGADDGAVDDGAVDDGADDGAVDDGIGFIEGTGGDPDFQCDPWTQDCPAGQKCNPWADDGGVAWNATRCVDIASNPRAVGQSCTVVGIGTSGEDNCVLGSMCWGVDPDTDVGTCVALCQGSPASPSCGGGTACVVSNNGALPLCLDACNPLAQSCPQGEGCYPLPDALVCAPDASGDAGVFGDTCTSVNGCDPGLLCIDPAFFPGCGGIACCTDFCNVVSPSCPGATTCIALFDPGAGPPGSDNVGFCGTP